MLRPGGVLLVAVPAFMFLWGKQDEVSHHRRRYTARTLRARARRRRLRRRAHELLQHAPVPADRRRALGRRLLRRPGSAESDFDLGPATLNRALGAVFGAEAGHRRAPRTCRSACRCSRWRGRDDAPVGEAVRFATVGVLQNGLNVAVFALATASASTTASRPCSPASSHWWRASCSTAQWTFTSAHGADPPPGRCATARVRVGGRARRRAAHVLRRGRGPPRGRWRRWRRSSIVAPLSFLVQRAWVFRAPRRSAAPRG